MKVMMLGNCQAAALAAAWSAMRPQDDVAFHPLHTMIDDPWTQGRAERQTDLADIILHQPVPAEYPVAFGRTVALQQRTRAVRVCVPDFQFTGLHPDILPFQSHEFGFPGPMGEYHSRIVLAEFLSGNREESALEGFESEQRYAELGYFHEFARSIEHLERRDRECHVAGTPLLLKHLRDRPTLYTIDHPTNVVFKELLVAVFTEIGLDFDDVDPEYIPPTLATGPVWPPSALIHAEQGLTFPVSRILKTDLGGQRVMSLQDFVWESYQCYRDNRAALMGSAVVQSLQSAPWVQGRIPDERGPPVRQRTRPALRDLGRLAQKAEHDGEFAREIAGYVRWLSQADAEISIHASRILAAAGDTAGAIEVLSGFIAQPALDTTLRSICADRLIELGASDLVLEEITQLVGQKGLNISTLGFVVQYAGRLGKPDIASRAALPMEALAPH